MKTIKITCESCGVIHDVPRTNEIPDNVISLGCNWCPNCDNSASEEYKEWYNESGGDNAPDAVPNNQTKLF